jgi:hypothetical protein
VTWGHPPQARYRPLALSALGDASAELKNAKELVLAAVAQNGYALLYTSVELKNDKEVVLAAVAQHGRALRHASVELKNDKEVIL